jgi:hypothetical protein
MQIANSSTPLSAMLALSKPQAAKPADPAVADAADSTLQAGPTPPAPGFDAQLLTALLNAQEQGSLTPSLQHLPDIRRGEAPAFIQPTPSNEAFGGVAIVTSDGALSAGQLQGQTAETLAGDLTSGFGSGGTLSRTDVETAFLQGGTAPPEVLDKIRQGLDTNWNALFGGAQSVSSAQLAAAISKYLPGGSGAAGSS